MLNLRGAWDTAAEDSKVQSGECSGEEETIHSSQAPSPPDFSQGDKVTTYSPGRAAIFPRIAPLKSLCGGLGWWAWGRGYLTSEKTDSDGKKHSIVPFFS